ncbi:nuclear transport factor 2 family protein [Mycolicibacterium sp.]|uniref:nuclear transport factor 2 family protein n=1 Tax=Mycolicibacterium sp. TaxID=2320850 RepID=UPI0037C9F0B4
MNSDDLEACHELSQAKARYCRLMDTKDWSALGALFTDDVVVDLAGGDPSTPALVGREQALAAIVGAVGDAITVHQVHAPEFELAGDEARVTWAVQERVVWPNGASLHAYGHYHDRWVRCDDRWLVAELRLTHLLME